VSIADLIRRPRTTLRIAVQRGRVFTAGDVAGVRVTVISETAARRFWPNEAPIDGRV
jgi:hypothetical protein